MVRTESGNPLVLYFDNYRTGPAATSFLNWIRKRFELIGITLEVRTTDYNRFRDKARNGSSQILMWGWHADYPDPENFLFLLYGPNSKFKFDGENVSNYDNPEFNRLFDQMQNMDNSPERLQIIRQMKSILQQRCTLDICLSPSQLWTLSRMVEKWETEYHRL